MHQIALDGSPEDVEANGGEEAFKLAFRRSVADMLDGVDVEKVIITSMGYGSIILEFYIVSLTAADDVALTSDLEQQLADAVSVNIAGRSVVDFATVRPPTAASTSIQGSLSATVPEDVQAADSGNGASDGVLIVVLVLILVVVGVVGYGVWQKSKQRAEEQDKAERSESVQNPMNAAFVGSANGGASEWKEVVDQSSGRTYYVNRQTKATTWDRPAALGVSGSGGGAAADVRRAASGASGGSHPVWKEVVDQNTGKTYYVNRQTKATTWDRPAELAAAESASSSEWVEHFDKERNRPYYSNKVTKETSWTKPADSGTAALGEETGRIEV